MKYKKGFTLIELLIVVAIISLLATLAFIGLTQAQQRARDAKRISDAASLQRAIELYRIDNGVCPFLSAGAIDTWGELENVLLPYISILPTDPNHVGGSFYFYLVNAGTKSDSCYFRTVLENGVHHAFSQDVDDTIGGTAEWRSITSSNVYVDTNAIMNCNDAPRNYCIRL